MAAEYPVGNEELVDGIYHLGALIRRSAGSAVYETEFGAGEDTVPAAIRIREVDSAEAEILSHRLRNVTTLEHPNLLKIYAIGSSMLKGAPVFYVVMERADESLEAVLTERPLTRSETREMLAPTLEALDYLHKNGYAHSRLRPSNVQAVNDRVKLSADSVTRVNDGEAAEDMRALGALLAYSLTQTMGFPQFAHIPQPLADIVSHCLDPDPTGRWTVDQVRARLNEPIPAVEAVASTPEEAWEAGGTNKRVPKWIYACLATLILTVFLAAVMRNKTAPPVAAPVAAATQQQQRSQEPETIVRTARNASPGKASGWSVIVAAYSAPKPAEKRMRELTKRWPNFKISVVGSQGEKTPYLLILGRNLSEDQAQTLRKQAIESGLPRDTYIKRLTGY